MATGPAARPMLGRLAAADTPTYGSPAGAGHASVASPRASSVLNLVVGVQQSLTVGTSLARVAIGDPDIADVMVMRGGPAGSLLLIAKAPGQTSLLVWPRDASEPRRYTVNVVGAAARALADPNGATVSAAGTSTLISGASPSMVSHERAVSAAKTMTGKEGSVVDQSSIAVSPVVQVDVKVVEFSRSLLKEIGINFQKMGSGFSYGIANPGTTSTDSPIASAFNLIANWSSRGLTGSLSVLEDDGLSRVLAEPTLVALSGQSANFLAGGEVPIPVPQGLGSTAIEYKPYGVGLTLTPTVLGPNRIALKVAPEASDLDFAHGVTISGVSVPAILTRRADTTVELGDGESFVIGGLIDRETITSVDKVPFLGDLPVIGAFFKSLNYQQTDKELVIVVTPHLVSPLAKGAVVPLPGEKQEQREGGVWRSFVGGMASDDALPGFSK
ncbi:type II and III secretion system protein family protein [Pararobbsia silviterrae]